MPDSKKKKAKTPADVVNFSVRFTPELFDKLEKYLGSIKREDRPSKDQAIQNAVRAQIDAATADPSHIPANFPGMKLFPSALSGGNNKTLLRNAVEHLEGLARILRQLQDENQTSGQQSEPDKDDEGEPARGTADDLSERIGNARNRARKSVHQQIGPPGPSDRGPATDRSPGAGQGDGEESGPEPNADEDAGELFDLHAHTTREG